MYNEKKYFKIEAETTTVSYIYVEADDEDQARGIAEAIDGGLFIPDEDPYKGDWAIVGITETTTVPPDSELYTPS